MHRNICHVFYTSFEINIFCDKCTSNVINGKLSAYEFKKKESKQTYTECIFPSKTHVSTSPAGTTDVGKRVHHKTRD